MPSRLSSWLVLLTVVSLQSGCALIEPIQHMSRETWRAFKPRPNDYRDPTQEANDEWAGVGTEARGDKASDFRIDSWLSPKAQSIERNTGGGFR